MSLDTLRAKLLSDREVKAHYDYLKPEFNIAKELISMRHRGEKHPSAKPLKGFKGAGVLEVVEDSDGDTYRAVYTVKLAGVIYVLHAFQKKSKQGIATPKQDIELIESRLKRAKEHYKINYSK
jgi:phage-related protein